MLLLWTGAAACDLISPAIREPTPREALERAAKAMETVNSAQFSLDLEGGTMQLAPGMQVTSAQGEVASPDRVRLKFKLRLGTMAAEAALVVIGDQVYLTNPLTGRWARAPSRVASLRLLDQERGLPSLLRQVADPQKVATETLDGIRTYRLRGTLEPSAITELVGGRPVEGPVIGEVWIGTDDFLVRQVRLAGAIAIGEKATTVRLLKFWGFNQPVSIEPPL